jgi:hypothetical protein
MPGNSETLVAAGRPYSDKWGSIAAGHKGPAYAFALTYAINGPWRGTADAAAPSPSGSRKIVPHDPIVASTYRYKPSPRKKGRQLATHRPGFWE